MKKPINWKSVVINLWLFIWSCFCISQAFQSTATKGQIICSCIAGTLLLAVAFLVIFIELQPRELTIRREWVRELFKQIKEEKPEWLRDL